MGETSGLIKRKYSGDVVVIGRKVLTKHLDLSTNLSTYSSISTARFACCSLETITKFAKDSIKEGRFDVQQGYDVVFVDAGHLYRMAWLDILNAAPYAKPGSIVIVDDCSTDLYNRADGKLLAEVDSYKFHVGLAFRHAVAMGIVEPLCGDVNGDVSLCVGRYRMHQVDKYRNGFPLTAS